jgi:hypothetical protein
MKHKNPEVVKGFMGKIPNIKTGINLNSIWFGIKIGVNIGVQ